MNRRRWIPLAVDAVMGYWLSAIRSDQDEEERYWIKEWWSSGDAPDSALEIVHAIKQALEEGGFRIVDDEEISTL